MKIKQENMSGKKKLAIAAGIIVIILAIIAAVIFLMPTNDTKNNNNPQSSTQSGNSSSNTPSPESPITEQTEPKEDSAINKSTPSTPQSNNSKSAVTVGITAANQNDATVQIRTIIYTPTNTGSCTLTLTKGSTKITKTASVQALPSSTTCKGFDIPISELSAGKWQIMLHFENTELTGDATGSITVE